MTITTEGVIVLDYRGKSHGEIVENLKNHIKDPPVLDRRGTGCPEEAGAIHCGEDRLGIPFIQPTLMPMHWRCKRLSIALRDLTQAPTALKSPMREPTLCNPGFVISVSLPHWPDNVKYLRDIAYNLWWTWNPEIHDLFARLDPQLWEEVAHNPIELLERASDGRLQEMAENESYMRLYRQTLSLVDTLQNRAESSEFNNSFITAKHPIAYFSTEYGLHESLPIYSGGLGVLSGDHLKSASSLSIPLVGVGLLYKSGYFYQQIDKEGVQHALYPENDFSRMPVRICDTGGRSEEALKIDVGLPGRKLYAQAWKVAVGRVTLYLLDTAIPENSSQDMNITSRLYGGDQRLRIEQEIMLGIGGVAASGKAGHCPRPLPPERRAQRLSASGEDSKLDGERGACLSRGAGGGESGVSVYNSQSCRGGKRAV